MPLYEYRCEACEHRFELIQRFSDAPVATCPSCGGGPVVKLLSSPAIQFKGSGWYITDYARKGKEGGGTKEASAAKKDAASPEGGSRAADASKAPAATTTPKE